MPPLHHHHLSFFREFYVKFQIFVHCSSQCGQWKSSRRVGKQAGCWVWMGLGPVPQGQAKRVSGVWDLVCALLSMLNILADRASARKMGCLFSFTQRLWGGHALSLRVSNSRHRRCHTFLEEFQNQQLGVLRPSWRISILGNGGEEIHNQMFRFRTVTPAEGPLSYCSQGVFITLPLPLVFSRYSLACAVNILPKIFRNSVWSNAESYLYWRNS